MYKHAPADYICPFCNIARGIKNSDGSGPQDIFYKDEFITAFVGAKWRPNNPAVTFIIPNDHYENIFDIPEHIGHKIFDLSKKLAVAMKEVYKCDGVSFRQHNEPAGNQTILHYHHHVVPRYHNDEFYINDHNSRWVTLQDRAPYVEKLKIYFKKN